MIWDAYAGADELITINYIHCNGKQNCNTNVHTVKHKQYFYNLSLAPVKFEWNFRFVIFQGNLVIDSWGIYCEIALIWMSVDFTDYQSTLFK